MSEPKLPDGDARVTSLNSLFSGIGFLSSEYGMGLDSTVTEADYKEAKSLLAEQLGGDEIRTDVFIMLFSRLLRNMDASEIASKLDSSEQIVSAQLDMLVDIGVVNGLVFLPPGENGQKKVRYEINREHTFCLNIMESLE